MLFMLSTKPWLQDWIVHQLIENFLANWWQASKTIHLLSQFARVAPALLIIQAFVPARNDRMAKRCPHWQKHCSAHSYSMASCYQHTCACTHCFPVVCHSLRRRLPIRGTLHVLRLRGVWAFKHCRTRTELRQEGSERNDEKSLQVFSVVFGARADRSTVSCTAVEQSLCKPACLSCPSRGSGSQPETTNPRESG